MYFKELTLKSNLPEQAHTEIMYEIATARAEGAELIRINVSQENMNILPEKRLSAVIRLLKGMKQEGRIQFYATKESFEKSFTEAIFLQNKYPDVFLKAYAGNSEDLYVYIKI